MMKGDGGPAFPVEVCFDESGEHELQTGNRSVMRSGISMRDYFAAQALPALLQADGTHHFSERANEAYQIADAMLAAREAK